MTRSSAFDVFISYAHSDEQYAKLLYRELQNRGFNCWFDRDELDTGQWRMHIAEALRSAKCYVVILTPDALDSSWIQFELGAAIQRSMVDRDTLIIPILLKNTTSRVIPHLLYAAQPIAASDMRLSEVEGQVAHRLTTFLSARENSTQ